MTIKYKIIKTAQPGVKGGGNYSYYARISNRNKKSLDDLAVEISKRGTLRRSEVHAVLIELSDLIPELLIKNYSVQMGELGTFSLHAKSIPSETPEMVNESKIKGLHVAFRPGNKVKEELNLAKFTRR